MTSQIHPSTLLRREMQQVGLRLLDSGLVFRTWGNIACRLDDDHFLVTPSGRDYRALSPEEMACVNLLDLSSSGPSRPSSEAELHQKIFQGDSRVRAIIHTHQPWASALSVVAQGVYRFSVPPKGIGNDLPLADYASSGTRQLAENAAHALDINPGNCLLLRHHGAVCTGHDLSSAFDAALDLERACQDEIDRLLQEVDGSPLSSYSAIARPGDVLCPLPAVHGSLYMDPDPLLLRYSRLRRPMRPLLDDFAQIVGSFAGFSDNDPTSIVQVLKRTPAVFVMNCGLLSFARDQREALAISAIVKKNTLAYYTAAAAGTLQAINKKETRKLRSEYLSSYSKRIHSK